MWRRAVTLKWTNVSEARTASITRATRTEAVSTSETSVNFDVTTLRYIPEDSKLHTHRRENLKSRKLYLVHVQRELHTVLLISAVHCAGTNDRIVYKGKAVPLHAMEALGGRGGIAPTHS